MTDARALAHFHRTLSDLCRSEVPLGRAFRLLEGELGRSPLREAAAAMAADVEAGVPLAEAYRKRAADFPPLYASLVEAGAASGDLAGALDEIARIAAFRAEADGRIRRVLAYPIVVLLFVVFLFWFLYTMVVPQFASVFAQIVDKNGNPIPLPAITRLVFDVPTMVPATVALLAAAVLLFSFARDPIEGIRSPVGLLNRLPVVGPLRLNAALATMAAMLAALIRRGLPLDRALEVVASSADGPFVRNAAAAMAASAREGFGLGDAARDAGLLPPSMIWLLGTAEKQGDPARGLDEIASICRERVTVEMDAFATVLGPLLQLGLGLLVGTVVLAIFYPILKLQSALM